MKIVQINTFSNKSTGNIMNSIHNYLLKKNEESFIVWGRGRKTNDNNELYLDDKIGVYIHGLYTRITDKTGFASKKATRKLLHYLDDIKPDIVHLHNIHGYYVNIKMLFEYLSKKNIKVVWTLHDCWPFTGHCTHFLYKKCNKWKNGCYKCPQLNFYPKSYVDNSKWNYNAKKKIFNLKEILIVTPSNWLAKLCKESFLKNNKIIVINNGINQKIFTYRKSNFKSKYGIENKKIILGISSDWTERKGFNDFIELSSKLTDDYVIVLVGLSKKHMKKLPSNIIPIERTNNQIELADIYNASDVFFNPTYEDNYPTVNLEASACGVPVFTYDSGGSIESAINGTIVKNVDDFINKIEIIELGNKKLKVDVSIDKMCEEYYKCYKSLIK